LISNLYFESKMEKLRTKTQEEQRLNLNKESTQFNQTPFISSPFLFEKKHKMGAIYSMIQMGMAYCCCNTTTSILNTCLGSHSPYSTGRKRSVLLLSISVAFALLFQYTLAPMIIRENRWWKIYQVSFCSFM
jgi:hypothetical protein